MLAFTLARRDFREYDQMLTLYTAEKGKVEALARGIKKINSKNTAYLEPYFLVDIELVPGKEITHVTKVQPVKIYRGIQESLEKMAMVAYIFNLLGLFVQSGEKDEKIFRLLISWLDYLDGESKTCAGGLYSFIFKLLSILGLKPELNNCISCGSSDVKAMHFQGGGGLCNKCVQIKKLGGREAPVVLAREIQALKTLLNPKWQEGATIGDKRVFKMVHCFAQANCERKLNYFKLLY